MTFKLHHMSEADLQELYKNTQYLCVRTTHKTLQNWCHLIIPVFLHLQGGCYFTAQQANRAQIRSTLIIFSRHVSIVLLWESVGSSVSC